MNRLIFSETGFQCNFLIYLLFLNDLFKVIFIIPYMSLFGFCDAMDEYSGLVRCSPLCPRHISPKVDK